MNYNDLLTLLSPGGADSSGAFTKLQMLRVVIVSLILLCSSFAADVPASDASIRELLQITESRKLIDGMFPQFEAMIKRSMQEALKGHTLTPDEQETVDRMSARLAGSMKEELSWEQLEPLYMRIYEKSFSQQEIDDMLRFYKSPPGRR